MADTPDPEIAFRLDDGGGGDGIDDNDDEFAEARDIDDTPEHPLHMIPGDCPTMVPMTKSKPLTIKPEVYNGADDWYEYISHFEVCAELGRWSDEDKVLALAASLRGPARTYYISLPIQSRQPYTTLVGKLEQRFGSSRQQNRWLSKFEARRRQTDESIAVLADDLRQMSQKAYSNLAPRAQEALALNQLYKSISLEMKCRCIDENCKTVADAVEVIERYEAILGEGDTKKKQTVRAVGQGQSGGYNGNRGGNKQFPPKGPNHSANSMENVLQQMQQRLERIESNMNRNAPYSSPYGGRSQENRPCFLCGSEEHLMRHCPLNWRNIPLPTTANGNANVQENSRPSTQ